jgi:hypothetical protein
MNLRARLLLGCVLLAALLVSIWPRKAGESPVLHDLSESSAATPEMTLAVAPEEPSADTPAPVAAVEPAPTPAVVTRATPDATPASTTESAPAATLPSMPVNEAETPSKPNSGEYRGVVTRSEIRKSIEAIKPDVVGCYRSALKLDPTLGGTIRVTFEIESAGGYGKVVSGEVGESEIRSPFFEACVLEKIVGARFPEPRGGRTKITFPFHFDPGIGWGGAPAP